MRKVLGTALIALGVTLTAFAPQAQADDPSYSAGYNSSLAWTLIQQGADVAHACHEAAVAEAVGAPHQYDWAKYQAGCQARFHGLGYQ